MLLPLLYSLTKSVELFLYSSIHASIASRQLWSTNSIAMCFAQGGILVHCSCDVPHSSQGCFISCLWLLWSGHVCVSLCDALAVCGQCCVTRHKVNQLASGVSVSHTKGGGRAATVGGNSFSCVCKWWLHFLIHLISSLFFVYFFTLH